MDASLLASGSHRRWITEYEAAGLYPAFAAGHLRLLALMDFADSRLIRWAD